MKKWGVTIQLFRRKKNDSCEQKIKYLKVAPDSLNPYFFFCCEKNKTLQFFMKCHSMLAICHRVAKVELIFRVSFSNTTKYNFASKQPFDQSILIRLSFKKVQNPPLAW